MNVVGGYLQNQPPQPAGHDLHQLLQVKGEDEDFLTSTSTPPFCHQAGWRPAWGLEQIGGLWVKALLQPVTLSPKLDYLRIINMIRFPVLKTALYNFTLSTIKIKYF